MATKSLKFRATADWVLRGAEEMVNNKTEASVTIQRSRSAGHTGTLKIEAPEKSEVNKAVKLLKDDGLYGVHFTE